jgi:hypothetical protein
MKLEPFDLDKIKEYPPPRLIFDGHRMCRWWIDRKTFHPEFLQVYVLNGAWYGRYYFKTKKFCVDEDRHKREQVWVDHEFQRVVELTEDERLQWYVSDLSPGEVLMLDGKKPDPGEWYANDVRTLETPHWPKGLVAGQRQFREHDSPEGEGEGIVLTVGDSGDVWMTTQTEKKGASVHFTCASGGGRSPRVRQALVLLALAIQLDNENENQKSRSVK